MKRVLGVTAALLLVGSAVVHAQLPGIEIRAGGTAAISKRSAAFSGSVGTGSGTMSW